MDRATAMGVFRNYCDWVKDLSIRALPGGAPELYWMETLPGYHDEKTGKWIRSVNQSWTVASYDDKAQRIHIPWPNETDPVKFRFHVDNLLFQLKQEGVPFYQIPKVEKDFLDSISRPL